MPQELWAIHSETRGSKGAGLIQVLYMCAMASQSKQKWFWPVKQLPCIGQLSLDISSESDKLLHQTSGHGMEESICNKVKYEQSLETGNYIKFSTKLDQDIAFQLFELYIQKCMALRMRDQFKSFSCAQQLFKYFWPGMQLSLLE